MTRRRRIVVVGGGVTGLTVAYRLVTRALQRGDSDGTQVTLLEARAALGGNIQTERRDGFVIDGGPDSFVLAKPEANDLCHELGLADRLIATRENSRRVYVDRDGRLFPLPEGVVLTVPTRVMPLVRTPLLSPWGKARMALDLVLPNRSHGRSTPQNELDESDTSDESIATFITRRLGTEALERIAEPLLGGIYAGDVAALSIHATFPQLVDFERRHGGLIRGAWAQQKLAAGGTRHRETGASVPRSVFASLAGGMGELVDALRSGIDKHAEIRTGTSVVAISRGLTDDDADGSEDRDTGRFLVHTKSLRGDRESIAADHVVVTTPAHVAAEALAGLDSTLAAELRSIPYLSTATVVVAYARADIPHPLDAVGVIIPKREGRKILAATFTSSKWDGRAPEGAALLRVFFGGYRDPTALDRSDEVLVSRAREELAELVGVRAEPMFTRVFRFPLGNPQPIIGHRARVGRLLELANELPGLHLAGAAYHGVGIPDCVRQANEVAARID